MALFALSMLEIVIELDKIGDTRSNNNVQEDIVRYLTDFVCTIILVVHTEYIYFFFHQLNIAHE